MYTLTYVNQHGETINRTYGTVEQAKAIYLAEMRNGHIAYGYIADDEAKGFADEVLNEVNTEVERRANAIHAMLQAETEEEEPLERWW